MTHSFKRILYGIKDKTIMGGLENLSGSHKYSFEKRRGGKNTEKNKP